MRWIVLAWTFLCFPVICDCDVILNEVYYDAPGSDEGCEFVELINRADHALSLFGYAIEFHDGASETWTRLWEGTLADTIAAGGLFVVGGDRVRPAPDAVDPLGLQNGPDAIRLCRNAVETDLVGYGALDDERFYEGSPAPDAASGESLARRADGVDTNDNAADFECAVPSPGGYNVARRDVALGRAEVTPEKDARLEAGVERLVFRVDVCGIEPVGAGDVVVELTDSTDAGPPIAVSREVHDAIAPGGGALVEIACELSLGYHWIRARAVYDGDERPGNNETRLLRRVGTSPLLISEVMSHPREGCPEYVEFFNPQAPSYDLGGHWMRDASHAPGRITSSSRLVSPGAFVVLTSDAEALAGCFPSLDRELIIEMEGAWPSLNHTSSGADADSIIVLDEAGVPVERVAYPPQPSSSEGTSLERVDLFAGAGPHVWVLSGGAGGGSPGARSPSAALSPPRTRGLSVSPSVIDPTHPEIMVAVVAARDDVSRACAGVFDLVGRRVIDLGSASRFPATFVWDGRDESGRIVPAGVYVLACEMYSASTGQRSVEKVVVGCGRKHGEAVEN